MKAEVKSWGVSMAPFIGPRRPPEDIGDDYDEGPEDLIDPRDKEEPSLGDLNPLTKFLDLSRPSSVQAIIDVISAKIEKYHGLAPLRLESTVVCSLKAVAPRLRFIARFEIEHLTPRQIDLIEQLVKFTYPVKVKTRIGENGREVDTEPYLPISPNEDCRSKTAGYYFGPDRDRDSLNIGLTLHKDLGEINNRNFLEEAPPVKYIIEIREADIYQTDIVQFVVQVASILGQSEMLEPGNLLYEIYYDLLRKGLRKISDTQIYGMDEKIAQLKRGLIIPLANQEITTGLAQRPESALMIGVPGTGKTLIIEELLQQDTGVLIIPIDPLELIKEMLLDKDEQTLLPRISEVSRKTGKKVILHIDDLEILAENANTYSTFLNLLAGIRECGFYIIGSTNEPEKIPPALMQPERFGILVYCGLQSEDARFEIMKIHALAASAKLGIPLFASSGERDQILRAIAAHTPYFSPRYLAEIINVAKSFLLERIAKEKGQFINLTETDLGGFTLSVDDFSQAYDYVFSICDSETIKRRDQELKEFVQRSNTSLLGFNSRENVHKADFFAELRQKISGNPPLLK